MTTTNPELKAMAQYYRELEQATAKNAQAAQGAALHQKSLNKQLETTSRLGQELKGILAGVFSLYGAKALISNLVRVTGEFELQKVSLGAILHDLEKAESIIRDIKGLAVESPFQFKELTTYAKQLSAFSVPAEELFETTKMLADVSAVLELEWIDWFLLMVRYVVLHSYEVKRCASLQRPVFLFWMSWQKSSPR